MKSRPVEEVAKDLLRGSFSSIAYRYDFLTPQEKERVTLAEWKELCRWLGE